MKKRLFSLAVALVMVVSFSVGAYAANGFNKAVFDNAADVALDKDDMTGDLFATSDSLMGDAGYTIPETGGGVVEAYSFDSVSDIMNMNNIVFGYYADDWAFIDSVIIKIGSRRYKFNDIIVKQTVLDDGSIHETAYIDITSDAIPFMTYLIQHRSETVKVRLQGEDRDIDFILTDAMKNGIINIYNLYVAGGGTSKASMEAIDLVSDMTVTVSQD